MGDGIGGANRNQPPSCSFFRVLRSILLSYVLRNILNTLSINAHMFKIAFLVSLEVCPHGLISLPPR